MILRSAFSKEHIPVLQQVETKKVTSSSAMVTWTTDLPATSELHYGMKDGSAGMNLAVSDPAPSYQHSLYLTGLRAGEEYSNTYERVQQQRRYVLLRTSVYAISWIDMGRTGAT